MVLAMTLGSRVVPAPDQDCPVNLVLTSFDDHGVAMGCWESVRAAKNLAGVRISTIACGMSSLVTHGLTKG
jgi:hypothetical protein